MATKEHDKFEIVVALDIGTTYSGYAFQVFIKLISFPSFSGTRKMYILFVIIIDV
jgi:hypothetical protein